MIAQALEAEDYAYSRLIAYAAYQWPGYRDAAHHRLIARALEEVESGKTTRLMITMPPRHGKSMLASEFFPAWYMGRNPDHYVVTATYAQDLADDFGRKVKNQIEDASFARIFPGVGLADDSKSAKRFHIEGMGEGGFEHQTTQRGAYYAVGIGGPLTGRGAHLLLIDDPVKNREDADSEIIRKKTKDWYTSTAYTRLMPGGRIVVIQTRWHEDDLSGWLLSEHEHEDWVVLNLPAISPDGKALWAEQYPIEALRKIEKALPARDFQALYQQSPTADEGTYFKKDWFDGRRWQNVPLVHKYGTSDYATKDGSGDYTVHQIWGIDPQGDLYLIDRWRGQTTSDVWIERQCDLIEKHKPIAWFGEMGPIYRAVEPALMRRMRERKCYARMEPLPSIADKPTSARGFQARASMRKVWLPDTAEGEAVLDELLRFPAGKYDDEVDACSKIGRALDQAHPAIAPVIKVATAPRDGYTTAKPHEGASAWS